MRFLREPALSAISLSFIVGFLYVWSMISAENRLPLFGIMLLSPEHDLDRKPAPAFRDHAPSLFLVDNPDEVLNLGDHAANRRGILQLGDATDLVELEADQRRALRVMAADRAAGLLDLDRLCGLGHRDNSKKNLSA
jgi:hypothetical protein